MTAKEFLKRKDTEEGTTWTEDDESIEQAFIEFAQYHVEKALEAASVSIDDSYYSFLYKEDILNAYPKENIL